MSPPRHITSSPSLPPSLPPSTLSFVQVVVEIPVVNPWSTTRDNNPYPTDDEDSEILDMSSELNTVPSFEQQQHVVLAKLEALSLEDDNVADIEAVGFIRHGGQWPGVPTANTQEPATIRPHGIAPQLPTPVAPMTPIPTNVSNRRCDYKNTKVRRSMARRAWCKEEEVMEAETGKQKKRKAQKKIVRGKAERGALEGEDRRDRKLVRRRMMI